MLVKVAIALNTYTILDPKLLSIWCWVNNGAQAQYKTENNLGRCRKLGRNVTNVCIRQHYEMIKMNTYTIPVHIHRNESNHAMKKMIVYTFMHWCGMTIRNIRFLALMISMIIHPVRCIRCTIQCIQGNIRSLLKCLSGHPWYKTEWLLVAKSKSMGIISP